MSAKLKIMVLITLLGSSAFAAAASSNTGKQNASGNKSSAKYAITCNDYLILKETDKPIILGYEISKHKSGKVSATEIIADVEKVRPEIDEYCKVHKEKTMWQKIKSVL
ncbi:MULTISPECIES: HdeA/HdeB family chaperone [Aquitalea]|uniref:HdeA/HdeB family protein n=1 Tax=Aquitalea magnusonii TaxID=332411 RepID=A0A318JB32_9NEIS|nr:MULTISPECIES: HdeA/HdeB family chaperone [Aquitalea]PXX45696.1 HdeA/HdeB family protein [Aquitalea magnusonii]